MTSMIPAGAPMVRPSCSEQLDYEAELMVIIGMGGKHISPKTAPWIMSSVTRFSTTVPFANTSARPINGRPARTLTPPVPIGPVAVTPDELPKGAEGLKIESRVGDEILQSATTSDMLWSVPARSLPYLNTPPSSRVITLPWGHPLASATPRRLRAG
jgi:2-keto-4-pentenoate hydratase/2-oxohepta-3-ene-1,7-dioic acid hydratase in catechol pathway